MSQITDQIWIGSYATFSDNMFLKENNITHIISCAIELPTPPSDISESNIFRVDIVDDTVMPETLTLFIEGARKLNKWVSKGHKVFVHCFAGMSRSVSVVIAYLITYHGMSYADAFKLVKEKRRQANIHPGFIPLLLHIEKYARISVPPYK
jgi:atypical dual specificity phosphatase